MDKILKSFTAVDELRVELTHICVRNEMAYATNGHVLACVPAEHLTGKYGEIENYPDVEGNIIRWKEAANSKPISREIRMDRLAYALQHVSWSRETEKCPMCQGDGDYYFNDHAYTCRICKGVGEIKVDYKPDWTTDLIKIGKSFFSTEYIFKLFDMARFIQQPIMQIQEAEKSANIFAINDVRVVIMPIDIKHGGEEDMRNIIEVELDHEVAADPVIKTQD